MLLTLVSMSSAALVSPNIVGYDCSNPQGMVAFAGDIDSTCDHGSRMVRVEDYVTKEATIDLLQLTSDEVLAGFTCLHKVTRRGFHCGMWSHSSVVLPLTMNDRLVPVSLRACRQMAYERIFQDYNGQKEKKEIQWHINAPGETKIEIVQAGSSKSDGECTGDDYKDPYDANHPQYSGVVVTETHTIIVLSTGSDLVRQGDGITVKLGDQELPCDYKDEQCKVPPTYALVWRAGSGEQCPARKIKTIKGKVYALPSGEIFLGGSDAPVALRKVSTRWYCNTTIYVSEFPRIGFTETKNFEFNHSRPLRASDLTSDYVSRISHAYVTIGQEVRQTLNALERRRCQVQEGPHDRVLRPLDVLGSETWRVKSTFFRQVPKPSTRSPVGGSPSERWTRRCAPKTSASR